MKKERFPSQGLIRLALWAAIFFSAEALIYYLRWFVPYLHHRTAGVVPPGNIPLLWFIIKIVDNSIFLTVGGLLIRLINKYYRTGFFDEESLKVLNGVILSCIGLALLGAVQTVANNFYEVHVDQWTSPQGFANRIYRVFTRLLIFREPETMYFLLAIILWAVRQFVSKALVIKSENEAIV
jgi:hypothetical protein